MWRSGNGNARVTAGSLRLAQDGNPSGCQAARARDSANAADASQIKRDDAAGRNGCRAEGELAEL
jgi:hypothetical protein